jgi:uncharacterized protein (TIGR03083 family)
MALPRGQVSEGLLSELDDFEQLIRPLTDEQWNSPSRCAGWTVGDVARHVVGSMADVAAGRLDGLGTEPVTAREVAERAGRSAKELADECAEARAAAEAMLPLFDDDAWMAQAPGGYEGTLGDGVEALWFDTWMHAEDIRDGIGAPSLPGPAVAGAVSHVSFELRKRGESGEVVGDPVTWVLVATGRAEPSLIGADAPIDIYAPV